MRRSLPRRIRRGPQRDCENAAVWQHSFVRLLLKNLLFTFLVPGTVGGWLPWWLGAHSPFPLPSLPPGVRWLAAPAFAIGVAIYGWCVWDFMTHGRGTPAPIDPPRRLVIRGLYHRVRNPMYVGVLSAIAGWALWFRSVDVLAYAVVLAVGFHVFVRCVEEPGLRARFGEDYAQYCREVPRWWPKL